MVDNISKQGLTLHGFMVTLERDAETIRQIRNECRAYMTRSTEAIGPGQQLTWFRSLDPDANKLFLFHVSGQDDEVGWQTPGGYGLCRKIAGKWWLSGGLRHEFQGKGLGKQLFGKLVEAVNGECWLEVLEHNVRAFNTYKSLGFVETERQGAVVTMRRSAVR